VELEEKYFDLVWAARHQHRRAMYGKDIVGKEPYAEICKKYPEEIEHLLDFDECDWHHGFNSGALAIVRLLFPYTIRRGPKRTEEIELMEQMFLWLDT